MANILDFLKKIGQGVSNTAGELAAYKQYGPDFKNILAFEQFQRERAQTRAPIEDELLQAREQRLSQQADQEETLAPLRRELLFEQVRNLREAPERDLAADVARSDKEEVDRLTEAADPVKRFQRRQAEEAIADPEGRNKEERAAAQAVRERFERSLNRGGSAAAPKKTREQTLTESMSGARDAFGDLLHTDPDALKGDVRKRLRLEGAFPPTMTFGETTTPGQQAISESVRSFEQRRRGMPGGTPSGTNPQQLQTMQQQEVAKTEEALSSEDPAGIEELAGSLISSGAAETSLKAQESAFNALAKLKSQGLTREQAMQSYPGLWQLASLWAGGMAQQGLRQ